MIVAVRCSQGILYVMNEDSARLVDDALDALETAMLKYGVEYSDLDRDVADLIPPIVEIGAAR